MTDPIYVTLTHNVGYVKPKACACEPYLIWKWSISENKNRVRFDWNSRLDGNLRQFMFSFHFKISFCKSLDAFSELFHAKNLSELTRYAEELSKENYSRFSEMQFVSSGLIWFTLIMYALKDFIDGSLRVS